MTGSNQVSNVVSSVVTPVALSGVKTPLLNQFEGAAAAYSLRRLKSWDDGSRVVRVRRESDNTERDFSSVEVSDGTMARWVNEQPTLPLDLRELDTNTGERDGALIEAAAAYSLRKLKEDFTGDVVEVRRNVDGETEGFTADEVTDGTLESFVNASFDDELPLDQATGAAAAYSLRNLSSSYTGDVVEVRRSSDDAVQSFTASEVADGTLESWVNTDIDKLDLGAKVPGGGLSGNYTSGTDSADFSVSNEGSTGYGYLLDNPDVGAGSYEITFDVVLNSGSLSGITIVINDPTNYQYQNIVSGSNSFSGTIDNTGSIFFRTSDTSVADVSITNITLTQTTADGHVRTWYDQSGSDNHAVQTTPANQPKIVDSGTLVTDRDGKIALDGKGAQLDLPANEMLSSDGSYSLFSACDIANQTAGSLDFYDLFRFISDGTGGAVTSRKPQVYVRKSDGSLTSSSPTHPDGLVGYGASVVQSVQLMTTISNPSLSTGNNLIYADGGLESSSDDSTSVNTEQTISASNSSLFRSTETSVSHYISEAIYYPSDQSTKRRAIEENIANHYDISLAAFSRDGTVSTWYDQSGNTNDATQTDPTKQPKIVDADTYLGEIKFESGLYLEKTGLSLSGPFSTFSVSNANSQHSGALLNFGNFSQQYRANRSLLLQYGDTNYSSADVYNIGERNVMSFIFDSTSLGYYNGTEIINDAATGATATQFRVGNSSTGLDGDVKEVIIYNSNQSDNRTAIEANIGETYGITDIPAANDTVNGFVQTWYDQSGEGNDAVQNAAANQPKIVGEVTSGQPHAFLGAIDFDGTDDVLDFTTIDFSTDDWLLSAVIDWDGTDSTVIGGGVVQWALRVANSNNFSARNTNDSTIHNFDPTTSISTGDGLFTILRSSDALEGYYDGEFDAVAPAIDSTDTFQADRIGLRGSAYSSPSVKEIIIYDSDQSSNRPAIETNIANQYGITLS